ncbi:hypothetical protein K1719_026829 [Acacia pycnantha]|nr:hypothetical protein K1719_026829 [Acacia pycnantha]
MAKLGLVFLLLAQMLVLQSMAEVKPLQLKTQIHEKEVHQAAEQPGSGIGVSSEYEVAEAPGYRRLGKHHSSDKSVAGGGVIIGGLVTAIFAAVFCYIRVTRKRQTIY